MVKNEKIAVPVVKGVVSAAKGFRIAGGIWAVLAVMLALSGGALLPVVVVIGVMALCAADKAKGE